MFETRCHCGQGSGFWAEVQRGVLSFWLSRCLKATAGFLCREPGTAAMLPCSGPSLYGKALSQPNTVSLLRPPQEVLVNTTHILGLGDKRLWIIRELFYNSLSCADQTDGSIAARMQTVRIFCVL